MKYKVINKEIDIKAVNQLRSELNIPSLLAGLLYARGIKTVPEAIDYLEPDLFLLNPFLLRDMTKAVIRIARAWEKEEKVVIFGDFDVDGITSTAILMRFFEKINKKVDRILPKQTQGHGLSVSIVEEVKKMGGTLIITVDNGVSSFDAVDRAKEYGIDVIITDHHDLSHGEVPKAYAVINPKQAEDRFSYKFLSGGGLAFFLARALADRFPEKEQLIGPDLWVLAAISTIADVAPLTGENRKIVQRGLSLIKGKSDIAGLDLLMSDFYPSKFFSARDVAFKIAPLVNVAGKFSLGDKALSLILDQDPTVLRSVVKELVDLNKKRKEMVEEALTTLAPDAETRAKANDLVLVLVGQQDSAINGLLAARIKEQYQRPTIIFSLGEGGTLRGSGRSVDGFNIQKAIEELSELHLGGGGHYMAAGLSINTTQIPAFRKKINEYAIQAFSEKPEKKWIIDAEVPVSALDENFFKAMKLMEPLGAKNDVPIFKIRGVHFLQKIGKKPYQVCQLGKQSCFFFNNQDGKVEIPNNIPLNIIAEVNFSEGKPHLLVLDSEFEAEPSQGS